MLLRKEKPGPVGPEFPRPDQSVDRAVSLGHVQPGRLVIFVRRHTIQTKRNKSSRQTSLRVLPVQLVSPDRIELVQLIVQPIATIFCHQNRISVIYERNIIEGSMVGVAKHNERYGSSVSVSVEIDAEHSPPRAARRQH